MDMANTISDMKPVQHGITVCRVNTIPV